MLFRSLAKAWGDTNIDVTHPSVFLGQLRAAWHQFHPDENDEFPHSLISWGFIPRRLRRNMCV